MNDIEIFFSIASPATLASLILDAQDGTPEQQRLALRAWTELVANVGREDAEKMTERK